MSSESLSTYYAKWDKLCSSWNDDEQDSERPKQQADKPAIDPKDISVSFGTPMTEEEFKSRHKTMTRGSTCQ